jgi:hypothetical protein
MQGVKFLFFLTSLLIFTNQLYAQRGKNDTIRLSAYVVDKDTLPHQWLNEVFVTEKAPEWLVKQRRDRRRSDEANRSLRRNVESTYPYAVKAGIVLQDVDAMLAKLQSKDAKRQFKEWKENELKKQFKGELEDMTIDQGKILIKLIARETGKPCYEIVRELKGGFNAGIWQTVAVLFSHNLKSNYDPLGDDAAIEAIVQEIITRQ